MILRAKVSKQGKFWIGEIPILDAATQGKSKKELSSMLRDLIRTLANDPKLGVSLVEEGKNTLLLDVAGVSALIPAILQAQRTKRGLSIREVATRLGYKNHNSYAAYELGKSVPNLDKFEQFLKAIAGTDKSKKIAFHLMEERLSA